LSFELECIDRVYLNLYVPKPAFPGGIYYIYYFFTDHRGHPPRPLGAHGPDHEGRLIRPGLATFTDPFRARRL
jgi:hypothetical protein